MTDIQQWRRMIQPTRLRTSAIELDDSDGVISPITSKRGLGPKLSSYFGQHAASEHVIKPEASFGSSSTEVLGTEPHAWPDNIPYPQPKAELLIESTMCRLMSEPYQPLDVCFNSALMQIFERFRDISHEKAHLAASLSEAINAHKRAETRAYQEREKWEEERQVYKAEVKRLELVLAKSQRGLAEITIARHDSYESGEADEDDHTLQTIFEFLARSRRAEEKAWNHQRAKFRTRAISPSLQTQRLTKQLERKVFASSDEGIFSFAAAPAAMPGTLMQASRSEQQAIKSDSERDGDQHHLDERLSTAGRAGVTSINPHSSVGTTHRDDEPPTTNCSANTLHSRRHIDSEHVLPRLMDLSNRNPAASIRRASMPTTLSPSQSSVSVGKMAGTLPDVTIRKQPSFVAKASGLFHRRKAQIAVDSVAEDTDKFSFEAGDDDDIVISTLAAPAGVIVGVDESSTCHSNPSLGMSKLATTPSPPSNIQSSVLPTVTNETPPAEVKRTSRIPTPVYLTSHLARPREERDISCSSVLTAIKIAGAASQASLSTESSSGSPPSKDHVISIAGTTENVPRGDRTSANGNMLLSVTPRSQESIRVVDAATLIHDPSDGCTNVDHDHQLGIQRTPFDV